jgi:hypothetical protein
MTMSAIGIPAGYSPVGEVYAPLAEDNQSGIIAVSQRKIALPTYCPATFTSLGAATTANVKTGGAVLYSITAANRNAAARYLQIFNSTSSTATVLYQWIVPGTSGQIIIGEEFFTPEGWFLSAGLTWGVSTTAGSYVAATASETDVAGSYF